MSVLSDDTDALLLIPPNFFSVDSDSEDEHIIKTFETSQDIIFTNLMNQVHQLEDRVSNIENENLNLSLHSLTSSTVSTPTMFGSVDGLNSLRIRRDSFSGSKSLQTSPMKCHSHGEDRQRTLSEKGLCVKQRSNLLTSNSYLLKKEQDNKSLQEIDQYFKLKGESKNGSLADETGSHLNLEEVNGMLKDMEETNQSMALKLKITENISPKKCETFRVVEKSYNDLRPKLNTSISQYLNSISPNVRRRLEWCNGDGQHIVPLSPSTENLNEPAKDLPIVSLSNLWTHSVNSEQECSIIKQRLEEERYRRTHCEEKIQQLQQQILEQQERLAVAVNVDSEKDKTILRMKEEWEKLVTHWKKIEEQRNSLAEQLQGEAERHKNEVAILHGNLTRCEIELSKALDISHVYKDKCEKAEVEYASVTAEVNNLRTELQETAKNLSEFEETNTNMKKKCEDFDENKHKLWDLQNIMKEIRKKLKETEIELFKEKHENEKLTEKLRDEKNHVLLLEESKKSVHNHCEELKKKERSLKQEVRTITEQLEKTKIELKQFYQKQVEELVKEKLEEFQNQLNLAEMDLKKDMALKEKTIHEKASNQIQKLVAKQEAEIMLIEEKHKEELELNKIQLAQAEEEIKTLKQKLEKLHNHMETQWQQALKIITAVSSPSISPDKNVDTDNTKQPSKTMPITRQNTFTVNGDTNITSDSSSTSTSVTPFCRDDIITSREEAPLTYRIDETPEKISHTSQDHLRNYIMNLLGKTPGQPEDESLVDHLLSHTHLDAMLQSESTVRQWRHVLAETSSQISSYTVESDDLASSKMKSGQKPPWK